MYLDPDTFPFTSEETSMSFSSKQFPLVYSGSGSYEFQADALQAISVSWLKCTADIIGSKRLTGGASSGPNRFLPKKRLYSLHTCSTILGPTSKVSIAFIYSECICSLDKYFHNECKGTWHWHWSFLQTIPYYKEWHEQSFCLWLCKKARTSVSLQHTTAATVSTVSNGTVGPSEAMSAVCQRHGLDMIRFRLCHPQTVRPSETIHCSISCHCWPMLKSILGPNTRKSYLQYCWCTKTCPI